MPQGPMPTDQVPLQMANGGYVQRFRDGSDEEGVTPDDRSSPPAIDPQSARALLGMMGGGSGPSLSGEFERLLPVYEGALGAGDPSMTRAQMLFDISQAGLNLAAGTDAQGRPMRGSFASRLAGATQQLPERIAARAGQMRQEDQAIRMAALRGAEGSVAAQQKMMAAAMKDDSDFGKGSWAYKTVVRDTDAFAAGALSPAQERQYISAATDLMTPKFEPFINDKGFPDLREIPGTELPFVLEALEQRGMLNQVRSSIRAPSPVGGGRGTATGTATDSSAFTTGSGEMPTLEGFRIPNISRPVEVTDDIRARLSAAGAQGIDEQAVVYAESLGRPDLVSDAGAQGPWQVMPATAARPGFGVKPAEDDSVEELNRVGRDYWNAMKARYDGNPYVAAVAYNWGPDKADKWLRDGARFSSLPEETRGYLQRIQSYIQQNIDQEIPKLPEEAVKAMSLWEASGRAIGLYNQARSRIGGRVPFNVAAQSSAAIRQASGQIRIRMPEFEQKFRATQRLSEQERIRVEGLMALDPKLLQNEAAYKDQLISLGLALRDIQQEALLQARAPTATSKDQDELGGKAEGMESLLNMLGLPKFIQPETAREQLQALPPGTEVLIQDRSGAWIPTRTRR